MTAPTQDAVQWHEMTCGICGEVWPLPYAHPYANVVCDEFYGHWLDHLKRGEDPRVPAESWKAYVRPTIAGAAA